MIYVDRRFWESFGRLRKMGSEEQRTLIPIACCSAFVGVILRLEMRNYIFSIYQ